MSYPARADESRKYGAPDFSSNLPSEMAPNERQAEQPLQKVPDYYR
jgi:hypothetical protein